MMYILCGDEFSAAGIKLNNGKGCTVLNICRKGAQVTAKGQQGFLHIRNQQFSLFQAGTLLSSSRSRPGIKSPELASIVFHY